MDRISGENPMENPPLPPLAGLDPADLLRQGAAADTFVKNASAFHPPSIEELAPLFPQFEILTLIGQGGMGAVYQVRQKDLDRIVALKILPPAIGETAGFSDRFAREAKALARLNHPGIVTIHEFGQREDFYFILMEFVDGVNLAQLMRTGRIAPREALAIVPQICDALQYAHDQGIVHRDIKPENLLLGRLGRVKVADFGIAKIVGPTSSFVVAPSGGLESEDRLKAEQPAFTEAGKIIGTPQYMAPEQIDHPCEVDHRADIYSLGVVFYQMLTGELPGKDLHSPSRKVQIDVRLDEVVLRALEENPDLRFQNATLFKTQVETIAGGVGNRPLESGVLGNESLGGILDEAGGTRALPIWQTRKGVVFAATGLAAVIGALTAISIFRVTPVRYDKVGAELSSAERRIDASNQMLSWHAALRKMEQPDRNYGLGPIIERVLPVPARQVPFLLDFENGNLQTANDELADWLSSGEGRFAETLSTTDWPTKSNTTHNWFEWLKSSRINAVASGRNPHSIRLFATLAFPITGEFDAIDKHQIIKAVREGIAQPDAGKILSDSFGSCELISLPAPSSASYAFIIPQSWFGSAILGLFQVLGPTENADGVKIRYRLVHEGLYWSEREQQSREVKVTAGGEKPDMKTSAPKQVIITILEEGSVKVDDETFSLLDLSEQLKKKVKDDGNVQVVIRSPAAVPYWKVGEIINLCQKIGAWNLSFARDEKGKADSVAGWLEKMDGGNYAECYSESAAVVKHTMTAEKWKDAMTMFRTPLGTVVSRRIKSSEEVRQLPGVLDGEHRLMQFDTEFSNKKAAVETVVFTKDEDEVWKSSGYFIR